MAGIYSPLISFQLLFGVNDTVDKVTRITRSTGPPVFWEKALIPIVCTLGFYQLSQVQFQAIYAELQAKWSSCANVGHLQTPSSYIHPKVEGRYIEHIIWLKIHRNTCKHRHWSRLNLLLDSQMIWDIADIADIASGLAIIHARIACMLMLGSTCKHLMVCTCSWQVCERPSQQRWLEVILFPTYFSERSDSWNCHPSRLHIF